MTLKKQSYIYEHRTTKRLIEVANASYADWLNGEIEDKDELASFEAVLYELVRRRAAGEKLE